MRETTIDTTAAMSQPTQQPMSPGANRTQPAAAAARGNEPSLTAAESALLLAALCALVISAASLWTL